MLFVYYTSNRDWLPAATHPLPMAAQNNKLKLNLLNAQVGPRRSYFVFVKWFFSSGQFIVFIVYIIAILLFLAQVSLDNRLLNIKKDINSQIKNIEQKAKQESEIKLTQFKLTKIKEYLDTEPKWHQVLTEIANQIPPGVILDNLTLDRSQSPLGFKITGSASSNNDMGLLLKSLKSNSSFREVVLTNVGLNQGILTFTMVGFVN